MGARTTIALHLRSTSFPFGSCSPVIWNVIVPEFAPTSETVGLNCTRTLAQEFGSITPPCCGSTSTAPPLVRMLLISTETLPHELLQSVSSKSMTSQSARRTLRSVESRRSFPLKGGHTNPLNVYCTVAVPESGPLVYEICTLPAGGVVVAPNGQLIVNDLIESYFKTSPTFGRSGLE